MNNNNNCEMIRDLIPLYSEGLCSDESKKIVEEHTKNCDSCRKLLETLPTDTTPKSPVPDEGKAFRKVRKKMKRSFQHNIRLSVALAAVVILVGYLTVGQIVKQPEIQSFETVWQSIEVRQQVKKLFSGNIEGYMETASWGNYYDINSLYIQLNDMEEIREQDTENLKKTFDAAYGNAKIKNIDVTSQYGAMYTEENTIVCSDVFIEFDDGRMLSMSFNKEIDGLYAAYVVNTYAGETEQAFEKTMNFIGGHQLTPFGMFERFLTVKEPIKGNELSDAVILVVERFQTKYHEQVTESLTAFYEKGYLIEDCVLDLRYDEERKMLYNDMTLIAKDTQGTAIMKTRLYTTYEGLIPPTEDDITIYTDGCTEELAEDFAKLFG